MSIVSVEFLIFLTIVLLVYYLFAKKLQWVVLLAASYCFYCFAGSGAVIFVAATTLVVYASGIWMDRVSSRYDRKKNAKAAKKKILIGTVIVVFGVLFLLKYYDFFAANLGTYLLHNIITKNCRAKWRILHLQNGENCRGYSDHQAMKNPLQT